jgi:cytochrome c oxidase subunit IV
MSAQDVHVVGSTKLFIWIWFWLVLLTIIEVGLAYQHLGLALMIVILMGLSLMKSALIMAYFMHLKFERMSLVLTIIPALVILICLMFISFPDSVRIHQLTPR